MPRTTPTPVDSPVDGPAPEALRTTLLSTVPAAMRTKVGAESYVALVDGRLCLYYTRFSTARQTDLSTERQIEDCERYREAAGLTLAEDGIYSDEARSGLYMIGRESLAGMLARVEKGDIKVVVIADPSRLARDAVDLAWLHRELHRLGVELHAAKDGKLDATKIAVYGIVSQSTVDQILHNTSHARRAMVRMLLVPWGAKNFGFERDGHVRGMVKVCEAERAIVLEIFRLAKQGVPYAEIARILNAEGKIGRRKNPWTGQMIALVLRNVLYRGIIAYSRRKHVRDHSTLKYKWTFRPVNEWVVGFAEHLAIVDDELWAASRPPERPPSVEARAPARKGGFLLSNLVNCPECGKHMKAMGDGGSGSGNRFICSDYENNKECQNGRSWKMPWIEAATLRVLADTLDDRSLHEPYLRKLAAEAGRAAAEVAARRPELQRTVDRLFQELRDSYDPGNVENLPKAIVLQIRSDLSARYEESSQALSNLASPHAAIDVAARVAELGDLSDSLREISSGEAIDLGTPEGLRLKGAIRGLLRGVVPTPDPNSRGVRVEVTLAEMGFYDASPAAKEGPSRVVSGTHVPPSLAEMRLATARKKAARLLDSGVCTLADETWEAIRPLVPAAAVRALGPGAGDGRRLVEATLLRLRLGRPWAAIPSTYGSPTALEAGIGKLVDSDAWDGILSILGTREPSLLDGLELVRAGHVSKPTGARRRLSTGSLTRAGRGAIVRLVSRPQGATLEEIAAETGQGKQAIRTALTRLRKLGLHANRAWRPDGSGAWHAMPIEAGAVPRPGSPMGTSTILRPDGGRSAPPAAPDRRPAGVAAPRGRRAARPTKAPAARLPAAARRSA
ncbi:recombinase family protein [Methylobacterium oryzae]